ncbi:MAG TPA: PASTA domain-containing protein [Pyrinomonadaceae bacterium]|nr:PASTA domain-containing protein [Pyrinomonadaceae bacterium]
MSALGQTFTVIKRIAIVIGIALAFSVGLLGAIYLSLRSSETRVPDIVGKDRGAAENTISDAGLNFRVRAERATSEAKPGTVLIQLPHAGEIVKVGQTVAVDISRPTKDGEPSTPANANANTEPSPAAQDNKSTNDNANANTNKRKSNRNANGNDNLNGNANRTANRNQNRNTNRALNGNANSNGAPARTDANTPANRATTNTNTIRRPPVRTPTP